MRLRGQLDPIHLRVFVLGKQVLILIPMRRIWTGRMKVERKWLSVGNVTKYWKGIGGRNEDVVGSEMKK